MGWIEEAVRRGELKITENKSCPFCNLKCEINSFMKPKFNACSYHKWVSKKWYENKFKVKGM